MNTTNVVMPPGGNLEVVFSFDTTGSMYSWLDGLRGSIQDMLQRLQADIPGIKMAVFAHGDYCDVDVYVTKWIDFTNDVVKLCDFVKNVERTSGGDAPECYELVLRQARTELSWTLGSRRVLVMIGDNIPHTPHASCNKDKIDWKVEVKALFQEGVTIYGVQCGTNTGADKFYNVMSLTTGGKHLRLEDFSSLFDTLMAVCYREGNDTAMLANYEKEVRARCVKGGIAADIDAIFASLRNDDIDSSVLTTVKSVKSVSRKKTGIPVKILKRDNIKLSLAGTKEVHIKSKVSSKVKSSLDKYKEINLPLLKRENVPENNFSLRSLNWSPWTCAMVSDDVLPKNNKMWVKRFARPGYRIKLLPSPKSKVTQQHRNSALFEVAVQGGGVNKKRYVVFSAYSSVCFGMLNWEKRLLGLAMSQVDHVLKAGGRVYLRFCVSDRQNLLKSRRILGRYDYAWRKVKRVRSCPRDVIKGRVSISVSA